MLKEQCFVSDYLEEYGLKEDDIVNVLPTSGKGYKFTLNRTRFDFVCDYMWERVESICKKRIVAMNSEKWHVQIKLIKVLGRNNAFYYRYQLKVLEGGAIKLNGTYVLEAILEKGDHCEIGFNRLQFLCSEKQNKFRRFQDQYLVEYKNVIRSSLPILIQGETGTGKTSMAKLIHRESGVPGDFIHLNLASFSHHLIESELFGHIKGSFTGATQDKKGAFRMAEYGTLFIDEIDSLPWELQTKLLLFLDDYRARAVGDTREYCVQTRLIFASGRNLVSLVEKNQMRKDFFFRLTSGQVLKLKSLRDEPQMVIQFCEEFENEHQILIDKKLLNFYTSLPWPGNYRQLGGHLLQKKILAPGKKLTFDEVDRRLIEQGSSLGEIDSSIIPLKQAKLAYARKAFMQCNQNYKVAAQKLCITPRSLRNLLQIGHAL